MTQHRTNLAAVQSLYRAFRDKDYQAFLDLCAPDLDWIQNVGFPRGGSYETAQAVIDNVFKTFDDDWDGWDYRVEQYVDGGDVIVVLGRYVGRSRRSGRQLDCPAAHAYDVVDGVIRRFRQFADTKTIHDTMAPGDQHA